MNTNIDMDIQEPTSDNPSPSKGLLKLDTESNEITNVMTGPEWLERFINELPQGYLVDPPILAAARRASGDTSDE